VADIKDSEREDDIEVPAVWWGRLLTRQLQFVLDLALLTGVFSLSYLLRFEFEVPQLHVNNALIQLPFVLLVQFGALFVAGVYSFVWRYVGLREVKAFFNAAWWSFLPLLLMRLSLPDSLKEWRLPFSVLVLNTLLAFGAVLGLRVLRRLLYERYEKQRRQREQPADAAPKKRVLLFGAGRAGVMAVREIQGRGDMNLDILGFVDDDPEKQGLVIHGVKVLGTARQLGSLVRGHDVDHVIITIASAARQELRRIARVCEEIPVRMRIIPGLYELLQGEVNVTRIRDVQIDDLLGRDPVSLDPEVVVPFVERRCVMVTGAGGSIGSELARQLARLEPRRLLLVERAEGALFEVHRELLALKLGVELVPVVADVGDKDRMRAVFARHRPEVVFHAAAHKHVPLMEENPTEAITNNVLGTRTLGELAGEHGATAMVLISTDKAVRSSSVMGASKRVAELVIQDLDGRYDTRFVAVRFGNVLGSAGSVIPLFKEQIIKGGPVQVTHPDMVRYFMTIPEASQLVMQAGAMGEGGEIFILDMGEPVRIVDLAEDMIRLSGFRPYQDIDIEFTGMRPGEKLFEELATDGEEIAKTRHPKIYIGRIGAYAPEQVSAALERLKALAKQGDGEAIRRHLAQLLPESKLTLAAVPPSAGATIVSLPAMART
jgi:FlaA1/EpsC-like NDP-sugar epimerase